MSEVPGTLRKHRLIDQQEWESDRPESRRANKSKGLFALAREQCAAF